MMVGLEVISLDFGVELVGGMGMAYSALCNPQHVCLSTLLYCDFEREFSTRLVSFWTL